MLKEQIDRISQKIIEISFYALFFITPLLMNQANSELFELPKMFFVWAATLIIVGIWLIRMIANGKFLFRRTFLDIPLLIFLVSQFLSYFVSIDRHTSFWGYYSRFNGGLVSTLSYALLYWAFVSNMDFKKSLFTIHLSLITGLLVALWGIPAHFGYDPTCFVFGYGLNTNCWTAQFVPTVRIFSTLGQPNWLAAWLVALMPLTWAILLNSKHKIRSTKQYLNSKVLNFKNLNLFRISIFGFRILTIVALLLALFYTRSQSGFAGLAVALVIFLIGMAIIFRKKYTLRLWNIFSALLALVGVIGVLFLIRNTSITQPITSCLSLMFSENLPALPAQAGQAGRNLKPDITPSGDIRCIVWKGAIQVWRHYPILGTGPETFAYSYYQFRPIEHNLTSEWDFLYNKAHNEYLNFAANTGTVGLGAYLFLISSIIVLLAKNLQFTIYNLQTSSKLKIKENENLLKTENLKLVILALTAGYASILVTNFFGFSVVPVQIQFFLYPAIAVILVTSEKRQVTGLTSKISTIQVGTITIVLLVTCYLLLRLTQYYLADIRYARAERSVNKSEYVSALSSAREATALRPSEPLYHNELSDVLSALVLLFPSQDTTTTTQFVTLAQEASDRAITTSPRNLNFLRTRSTVFVRLATLDPANFARAAQTLEQARELAPTEPKIAYNLGFLSLQIGELDQAITHLSRATTLRPLYRDAWFALGQAYWEKARLAEDDESRRREKQQARDALTYILENINPADEEILNKLNEWK